MTEITRFEISKKLAAAIINNEFCDHTHEYQSFAIHLGLGIEFDAETFTFSKEPGTKHYTVLPEVCLFQPAANGIIRNISDVIWPKAEFNWTEGEETIKYIGLYYDITRKSEEELENDPTREYELIAVLPLFPEEQVFANEIMVLNAGSIQIRLTNL